MRRILTPICLSLAVVRGAVVQDPSSGLDFFGGIPFAEAPVGELRWKPPVLKTLLAPNADNDTFNAQKFGAVCVQSNATVDTSNMSEDCLTLNIFRPTGLSATSKVPVLFWTFGGGFYHGAGVQDASRLVTLVVRSVERGTPIVFVSFNYRVGAFGFPQGQEAHDKGILNLGLKDQLAALWWVQTQIAAFGGDPKKILNSGVLGPPQTFPASKRADSWKKFVQGVPECKSLASTAKTLGCLRRADVSTESLVQGVLASEKNITGPPFLPVLDASSATLNPVLRDYASKIVASGAWSRLPTIVGTNLDVGTNFAPPNLDYSSLIVYTILGITYTPAAEGTTAFATEVEDGCPYNTGNETFGLDPGFKRAASIIGDTSFEANRRWWSQRVSVQNVSTYNFLFTQPQKNQTIQPQYKGVYHGAQNRYIFGSVTSSSDVLLSTTVMDYYLSFVNSLDPNDGLGVPRFSGNDDADVDEVEDLLRVDKRENDRLRAKRTRSVTFEFEIEIKTEDEDDSSLSASLAGTDQDSGDSDWPRTPRHQLVVEVPQLSPEEKQAYTSTTTQHDENGDVVSPLKMGARQTRTQRARNARPSSTVSPDKPKAAPAKARAAARKAATRRKVKVEEEETSRSRKRRKLNSGSSSSSDVEEIPPPPRVTRSRKSVAQTTTVNGKPPIVVPQVDDVVVAPARATRRHAAVVIKEEPTEQVVPLRRSPRKRAQGQ
ncbi:alpha/beta-hydrolase [Auricularia subglabra TFB-10046 SS5]|nr:alpha/beta-hydrolase [Auricularia subglabra TFB-10046 SS5]